MWGKLPLPNESLEAVETDNQLARSFHSVT